MLLKSAPRVGAVALALVWISNFQIIKSAAVRRYG
jgi:hypothetical protein